MAKTVHDYLAEHEVEYDVVPHAPAGTSMETAEHAHVPGRSFAKAVVVEDRDNCALVVVPATDHIHLGELRRELGSTYGLATEGEVRQLFADCDPGSVPPFGQAYGLEVLVDSGLLKQPRVFVESGDRAALLAISGEHFRRLMKNARSGRYGHPA
ncbi:MAG: aminoacyl-tRNA deacylase [Pseudomonadales bacterium]